MRQEFSNQVAIITKSEQTSSIMFDGQPVTEQTQWSKASNWGYSYAAFPVTHGVHYITVTKDSRATFSAYVYGHSLVDTSSSAYGYTAGFQGIYCTYELFVCDHSCSLFDDGSYTVSAPTVPTVPF